MSNYGQCDNHFWYILSPTYIFTYKNVRYWLYSTRTFQRQVLVVFDIHKKLLQLKLNKGFSTWTTDIVNFFIFNSTWHKKLLKLIILKISQISLQITLLSMRRLPTKPIPIHRVRYLLALFQSLEPFSIII